MPDKRHVGVGIAAALAVAAVVVLGMQPVSDETVPAGIPSDKIRVLASFFPYYEFTRNVAGDRAIVGQYLPDGTEAHDWEPRAGEILMLDGTDVFVYNGLGIEPYVSGIIESGEFDDTLFVKASEGISLLAAGDDGDHAEKDEHRLGDFDPHVWLDPILVKQQVNNIRDGLALADPDNESYYFQNAADYNAKLDSLDAKIQDGLTDCMQDTIVPFHTAFAYFGDRYGVKIAPLGGQAPNAEASAADIAEFIDFVRDNDIKVVFSEDLVDPRLAETIAAEAGAETLVLSPIEALTPEEASAGVTYLDKMEKNLISLRTALECQ